MMLELVGSALRQKKCNTQLDRDASVNYTSPIFALPVPFMIPLPLRNLQKYQAYFELRHRLRLYSPSCHLPAQD